jgi:hypothetical protein
VERLISVIASDQKRLFQFGECEEDMMSASVVALLRIRNSDPLASPVLCMPNKRVALACSRLNSSEMIPNPSGLDK